MIRLHDILYITNSKIWDIEADMAKEQNPRGASSEPKEQGIQRSDQERRRKGRSPETQLLMKDQRGAGRELP